MQHFQTVTNNQIVVMGERTFFSIGKPLKNRINIVLTNDENFHHDGVIVYHDYLQLMKDYQSHNIFIIGGISIYKLFFDYADKLIISTLKKDYMCNRFLKFNLDKFHLDNTIEHNEFFVNTYSKIK